MSFYKIYKLNVMVFFGINIDKKDDSVLGCNPLFWKRSRTVCLHLIKFRSIKQIFVFQIFGFLILV